MVKVANHMAHDASPPICGLHHCHCQLIVNVKAQSGEILKESFFTNASDDSVTLEFSLQDGSHTAQIVDFKQELQIFRVIMLGEEELDQSPFQVFCFVTKFAKGDFISSDAMSKLRQKNPTTVRTPEGDHGTEEFTMDLSLDVEDVDWDWSTVREATRRLPAKGLSSCIENSKDSSCICNHQICISWYPCGLKYCTGKDNSGKTVSYRCGIRTL
ncbi:Out at first protein [Armadillidium vulgare]|nr:Out at first protein [Armadillidium vulgare]